MILMIREVCKYGENCPYSNGGLCQGLNPNRTGIFTCDYVYNEVFIKDGQTRNPGDMTGKMKIIME